jgi:hypothetical protein
MRHMQIRRQTRAVMAALGVVVLLIGAGVVWAHHTTADARHDPSFRYGESLMQNSIYGTAHGDVEAACRAALANPTDRPKSLDTSKAVAGCTYAESLLNN